MLNRISLFFVLFFLLIGNGFCQSIQIGLFNDLTTKAIVFSAVEGNYLMVADGQAILNIKQGQNVFAEQFGDSIRFTSQNKELGIFKSIRFNSAADNASFSLRPLDPKTPIRFYDDNLEISMNLGKMQTVNSVNIDKYLAGVVESEGGVRATLEYYKTQSVLCRTYALSHLDRHADEGFHLCDGEHCQAYKGQQTGTKAILKGAFDTRGLVVIDPDSVFITAAFYSDCGGESESSENVWLLKKRYLKPIQDPYCQGQKNYRWEKTFGMDQWKNYLKQNGYKIADDVSPSYFNFTQFSRKQYYKLGKDSITFRKIRSDFKLRSAFFSIEAKDNNLILYGRGYGHGVGLCQEGAMQMSKLGYNFREIIDFYYQGVNVVEFKSVPVLKNPTLQLLPAK